MTHIGSGASLFPAWLRRAVESGSTLLNGLEHYWALDETSGTRVDSVGEADLTDNNTVGYKCEGPSGTVASFTVANSESLTKSGFTFVPDGGYTIAGWFLIEGPTTNGIVGTWGQEKFAYWTSDGASYFLVWDGGGFTQTAAGPGITYGVWTFGVGWVDEATGKIYWQVNNGTPVSASYTAPYVVPNGTFGFEPINTNGKMGQFGVWNRPLTEDERTSLFNSGSGKAYADLTAAEKVGLVSYWNLDEASGQRNDSFGTNHLTDNNTVESATAVAGAMHGTAASFVVANSESLSKASPDLPEGDFHAAIWINYDSGGSVECNFFSKCNAASGDHRAWRTHTIPGQTRVYLGASSDGITEDVSVNTGAGSINVPGWNLVEVRRSGTTIGVAVNGGAFSDGSLSAVFNGPAALEFGSRNGGTYGFFSGSIDEVAIWDRVLTEDERTELYASGAGKFYPFEE